MKAIDVDADWTVWVPVPWRWNEDTYLDHRDWARDAAEAVFDEARDRSGVDRLAGVLAFVAEDPKLTPEQAQGAYIHLPEPDMDVLPVYVQFFAEEDERDVALREMSYADGNAVEPPLVEPFSTERLGEGVRVLRSMDDIEDLVRSISVVEQDD